MEFVQKKFNSSGSHNGHHEIVDLLHLAHSFNLSMLAECFVLGVGWKGLGFRCSSGNFDHGAYKSGDKLEMKQDAFALFLSEQEDAYFQSFQERVAADRNEPYEPDMQAGDTMQDWLQTKALQNRGLYVAGNPNSACKLSRFYYS